MTGVMRIGPGTARRSIGPRGEDRGVVVARHGAVAPGPGDVDAVRREALLGDLDRVQPPARDRHRHAAALVDAPAACSQSGRCSAIQRAPSMPPASSSAVQVNRTSRRRPGIGSVAGSRPAARASRRAGRHAELEGDHALHVDRAAAVDVAVGDVRRERVVGPALRRAGHDVEMGQEQERLAAGPVAAEAGMDGAATGDGLDDLGSQPERRRGGPRGSARRGSRRRARRAAAG